MSEQDAPHLEGTPNDDQKMRLEDWLTELMLISRKYGILALDMNDDVQLIDTANGKILGIGLAVFALPDDENIITGFVPTNSILDGCWPVDAPGGPVEQRMMQNVFPIEEPPD